MIETFINLVLSFIVNIFSSAIYDQMGKWATDFTLQQANRLPKKDRDRWCDEWMAELNVAPDNLTGLKYALGLRSAVNQMVRELHINLASELSFSPHQRQKTSFIINGAGYYKTLCRRYFLTNEVDIQLRIVRSLIEIEPNESRRQTLLRVMWIKHSNTLENIENLVNYRSDYLMNKLAQTAPKFVPKATLRLVSIVE
jgi:hypothetical protein